MGGFTLWVEDHSEMVGGLNLPLRNIWFEVLEQAKLYPEEFNQCIIRCPKDFDFKCKEHGCLNRGNMVGFIFDLDKFLALHEKAREWLEGNPNYSADLEDWPDLPRNIAVTIFGNLIKRLRALSGKAKDIWWKDELEARPTCAREIMLSLVEKKPAKHGPVPVGFFLLDYDCAKGHLNDKELHKMRYGYEDSLITLAEAKKRGIVFVKQDQP